MSDHRRTDQRTRRREFRITVGLREGYHQDGPLHLAHEVTQVAADWVAERLALGEPVISGMITAGEVIYAGKARGGGVEQGREPVAIFAGEVIGTVAAGLSDAAVEAQLNELA